MRQFIERHASKITGVLSGFDRLLFRGNLLGLCHPDGVKAPFLARQGVLLKDFGEFVRETTAMLRDATFSAALELSVPTRYLESSRIRKEDVAKQFLAERRIDVGPICVLSAVEPCSTWQIYRSKAEQTQEPRRRSGKCLHLYYYVMHPEFGFMHVRIQTWMPYMVQIYVNGREWLGIQLAREGIAATRADNCFTRLANAEAAQRIMDRMLDLRWANLLDAVTLEANPLLQQIQEAAGGHYYWTIHQSEWATDVMFKSARDLQAIYPALTRHAISDFSSPDVMRFLGKKPVPHYQGEVVSDFKVRPEGICVRHKVAQNSIKMYDKAGLVLRNETTIQRPGDFKRKRRAQGKPDSKSKLRPMRKGIADLKARATVSQEANNRYLDALAVVDESKTVQDLLTPVLARADFGGRKVRALHPWSEPDLPLLRAIGRGEFVTTGFRNRDLLPLLTLDASDDPVIRKRQSARVSRLLRLLRAHGVIRKREGMNCYFVTAKGRAVIAAVLATGSAQLSRLKQCA